MTRSGHAGDPPAPPTHQIPTPVPAFPLVQSTVAVAITLAVGLGLAFGVLWVLGSEALGRHGWSALFLGVGAAVGGWLSLFALARSAADLNRPGPSLGMQGLLTAAMAGFLIRTVAAVAAALAAILLLGAERKVAGAWLLGWYIIFLAVDVTIQRRFFRLLGHAPAGADPDTSDAV